MKRIINRVPALKRPTDPWGSQEVDDVISDADMQKLIMRLVNQSSTQRLADFEIVALVLVDHFGITFNAAHRIAVTAHKARRQTRIMREITKVLRDVPKAIEHHVDPITHRPVMVHEQNVPRLVTNPPQPKPRTRTITRRKP